MKKGQKSSKAMPKNPPPLTRPILVPAQYDPSKPYTGPGAVVPPPPALIIRG